MQRACNPTISCHHKHSKHLIVPRLCLLKNLNSLSKNDCCLQEFCSILKVVQDRQTAGIDIHQLVKNKQIQVNPALFFDGVAGEEAAERGRVVAEVVVNEVELGIVIFRRPLEGLHDVAGSGDRAEGRVSIRSTDVAGGPKTSQMFFVRSIGRLSKHKTNFLFLFFPIRYSSLQLCAIYRYLLILA